MKKVLLLLKEENRRLNQLAEKDWLTGLYNRMAMEHKVNEVLDSRQRGVMFVIDVDNFKAINDRYGHIAGDTVLKGIADMLGTLTLRNDLLGRVGGDEFVIFMPISQGPDFIKSRCRQIEQRFISLPPSRFAVSRISLTVCGSCYQPGDRYKDLFDRADQRLLQEKSGRRKQKGTAGNHGPYTDRDCSLKVDMAQLSRELSEPGDTEGAYCQDYESFINIYRLMERRLKRIQSDIFSILITVTDHEGDFPVLSERGTLVEMLYQIIRHSMRSGDVFTRYSSCQFLVMVCDAAPPDTVSIARRIQQKFNQHISQDSKYELWYDIYPLKPAFSADKDIYGNIRTPESGRR